MPVGKGAAVVSKASRLLRYCAYLVNSLPCGLIPHSRVVFAPPWRSKSWQSIFSGCMRARGSTGPRMTAATRRVHSTLCGVVFCTILREVVCSLIRLVSCGFVNRARWRIWRWRIKGIRRRCGRRTGELPSKRTRSIMGIGGAPLPIWTDSLFSDIWNSLWTQSTSLSFTR